MGSGTLNIKQHQLYNTVILDAREGKADPASLVTLVVSLVSKDIFCYNEWNDMTSYVNAEEDK